MWDVTESVKHDSYLLDCATGRMELPITEMGKMQIKQILGGRVRISS
jgi:hypothetical protein